MGENIIVDEMRMFNCSCDEDAALIPVDFESILKQSDKETEEDITWL